jgi:uncharacterized protein YndB with AHSA1/START domain
MALTGENEHEEYRNLTVTIPSGREVAMTRVFDAPRHLVYEPFSKPELLKRWFGPRGWSLVVCEVVLGMGRVFRFAHQVWMERTWGCAGWMRGVDRELMPPERPVHMESFDDYPGESQVTAVFNGGRGEDEPFGYGTLSVAGGSRYRGEVGDGARRGEAL